MTTDTTEPFLAIIPNECSGGYWDKTHGVYLVNPLDKPLTEIRKRIGGWYSDDDGVVEANPRDAGPFMLAPRSALRLERSSSEEFDEFVCWWKIEYEAEGTRHARTFSAGKGLNDAVQNDECPVLQTRALIVMRSS